MRRNVLRNEQGFTLIEIIAVLVILGILAAVAIPRYLNIQAEAGEKACVGQIAEIKGRLSQTVASYLLANDVMPPSGDDLANFINLGPTVANICFDGADGTEGPFTFQCDYNAGAQRVQINVSQYNNTALPGGTLTDEFLFEAL